MAESVTIREFVHKIGFAVSLEGLNSYEKALSRIETKTEKMFSGADKLIKRLEGIGTQMSLRVSAPLGVLAGFSISAQTKLEHSERRWGALLDGNAEKGRQMIKQVRALADGLQFDDDQVNEYAHALRRLRVPIGEILPMIQKFSDISAGTGADAGEMMQEYVRAKNNPIMRGMMLRRLMMSGAITEADIRRSGIDPTKLRAEGAKGKIGMEVFDRIFNDLALKNAGRANFLAQDLTKNFDRFGDSVRDLREAIGGVLERVFRINGVLKAGAAVLTIVTYRIEHMSKGTQGAIAVLGGLLFVAGPVLLITAKLAAGIFFIGKAAVFIRPAIMAVTGTIWAMRLSLAAVAAEIAIIATSATLVYKMIMAIKEWRESVAGADATKKQMSGYDAINLRKIEMAKLHRGDVTAYSALSDRTGNAGMWNMGKSSPGVSLIVNNSVTLPPGTKSDHVSAVRAGLDDATSQTSKHLVRQVRAAARW
jgi:hypothetical protein